MAVAAIWLGARIKITGDLRAFMPEPVTSDQRLLLDILGHGPGERLMLIGLTGNSPGQLAKQSQALLEQLSRQTLLFDWVNNGQVADHLNVPERLLPYRYLLTDRYDHRPLDAPLLRQMLQARLQDVGSSVSDQVEPLIPRDPTLELLHVAEQWQPPVQPHRAFGVWFDQSARTAVLVAQTRAPGFDVTAQQAAVKVVEQRFQQIAQGTATRLVMSGPGVITVHINARTQKEAQWIGVLDIVSFILLLSIAYRGWIAPILGILPLATAGLAGLVAVHCFFNQVHAMTLAFGFTLIGVAQDYPIHLLSHQCPGISASQSARALWPTLATGVVATCIAYLTFFSSGVEGLRQLALFTIAGLGAAAWSTRKMLPRLMGPAQTDVARSSRLSIAWLRLSRLPQPRFICPFIGGACLIGLLLMSGPFWQNDLGQLTPISAEDLRQDIALRSALGAPDVRYVLAVTAASEQQALEKSQSVQSQLNQAVHDRLIANYDFAARYLPSVQRQLQRRRALPDPLLVRRWIHEATDVIPIREDIFTPFLNDLASARRASPVAVADIQGTVLASLINGLIVQQKHATTALITLTDVRHPAELAKRFDQSDVRMIDLKRASESLVVLFRQRILLALALAFGVLVSVVAYVLRQPARIVRVLTPMILSTIVIIWLERLCGVQLSLFHVISLILAACLGLDYALFFDHAGDNHDQQVRTFHALLICCATTFWVFLLLAFSAIPVLRAIGTSVALGVALNAIFAVLFARSVSSNPQQSRKTSPC